MRALVAAAILLLSPPAPPVSPGERNLADPAQAVDFLLAPPRPPEAKSASAQRWEGSLGKATVRTLFVVYREVLSSQDAPVCAFEPSCSRFSEQAIEQCGFVEGVLLSADRLVRDHPLAASYYRHDPATGRLRDAPGRYCLDRAGR